MSPLMKNVLSFVIFAIIAAILNAIIFPGPLEIPYAEGVGKAAACWGFAYLITWVVKKNRSAWLFGVSILIFIFALSLPASPDAKYGEVWPAATDAVKAFAALSRARASASPPVAGTTEEIAVGSCPSNIIVERKGEWVALSNDVEIIEILRSNPNRTSEVVAAYVSSDESDLEVVVLSLRGLEEFQGGISESDFNAFRAELAEVFQGPSAETQIKIDKVIEGNLHGAGSTGSHLRYEPAILSPGKLIGFAITEMNIPGSETSLYETAMKMQHIRGCIVQANFSIAVSSGSRHRLDQAISDFVMR